MEPIRVDDRIGSPNRSLGAADPHSTGEELLDFDPVGRWLA
jgi:hypothetical protein